MRVLFLSPAAELGGAERCLVDCIAAIRTAAHNVEITLLSLAEGPLVAQARALGAQVQVIETPRELSEFGESGGGQSVATLLRQAASTPALLRFMQALHTAIAGCRPDVVHSNGMKAHVLAGVLTPRRSRLVVHLHDFVGSRRASRRLLPALARLRPRAVFVANSEAVAEDFRRLAPRADVRPVYNVVDVDYFAPGPGEPAWLAELAQIGPAGPETVSFGLVATYARWKGHALFIEAAGRLKATHPDLDLRFFVVGGPIYRTAGSQVSAAELRALARRAGIEGCFGLVPFQADVARVFRSLNVVVHASTEPEPFGRTIVEAMACARPVIVSSAGGAAELFQHGENAWGVRPGDGPALAQAMAILLDGGIRRKLGQAGRAHAARGFSRTRLAAQLLEIYRVPGLPAST
jgi:glycosyltransferase involved in cell wall biosynthesis